MRFSAGKMITRWRVLGLIWCVLLCSTVAAEKEDAPPGLVEKDSEQDLQAEATGQQAQKREAALSNSYGEPLPPDAYGPPKDFGNSISDLQFPAPVYGTPEQQNTPAGAYGPPSPIVFPSQNYEGPPPPIQRPKHIYGPPKFYGPPKQQYGPPKPVYGPPKKTYGVPKQNLPKPTYGAPFKPQKIVFPKQMYGVPKPIYGPPKQNYGPPILTIPTQPFPEWPPIDLPPINVGANFGAVDFGQNLPAPIYGTPFPNLPQNLKPNFPIPSDTYGPPGHPLGPIGSDQQVVVHDESNIGHYGPPQPDPNPKPPHPGIPAPPTPPHVLYDGWKPIPGVSKPIGFDAGHHGGGHHDELQNIGDQYGPPPPPPPQQIIGDQYGPPPHHQNIGDHYGPPPHQQNIGDHYGPPPPQQNVGDQYGPPPPPQHIDDQYGPPPPPPPQSLDLHLSLDALPHSQPPSNFNAAQITTGYSNVHHDALSNIDINAITGGDTNHIDQSKTIFEAHYTEPQSIPLIQGQIPSGPVRPLENYGPPIESVRQHGAKGLVPPSGIYGVPPGSQYGAPPRHPPANLPIPYGTFSGGGFSMHTGGSHPKHPIKFREPVPDGLLQQTSHSNHFGHGFDHQKQSQTYIPPPIRDVKDINHQTGNHGSNIISIEPTNLYSLPHIGNPINFNGHRHPQQQQPSNLYGSPIDSYAVPLMTVDHTASGSSTNAVTATIDGSILANLTNLDAAEILKHCPYHEAIMRAVKSGEKIPADLASSYVASLSSLGSKLFKNQQVLISPSNSLNTLVAGSQSASHSSKDLSLASQTLVQTVLPSNSIKDDRDKNSNFKGKYTEKHAIKGSNNKLISEQILQTSEKIKHLNEEAKRLQQKIISTGQNLQKVNGQLTHYGKAPANSNGGSFSYQIQNSEGKKSESTIPHEQLLSEGLLQSILQAIEQPTPTPTSQITLQNQNVKFVQSSSINFANIDEGGLTLPDGYEPIDRTKEKKSNLKQVKPSDQEVHGSNKIQQITKHESIRHPHRHRGDIPECDLKADNSITHVKVVSPSGIEKIRPVQEINDNEVAIYFGENKDSVADKSEPVTEISVATSISENVDNKKEFGSKMGKKS